MVRVRYKHNDVILNDPTTKTKYNNYGSTRDTLIFKHDHKYLKIFCINFVFLKECMSDSVTNYNYVGDTNANKIMHIKRDISN